MKKPAVTSFLVAQKMMKKRIDKIEKLDLNFAQGSTDNPPRETLVMKHICVMPMVILARPRTRPLSPDWTEMKSKLS